MHPSFKQKGEEMKHKIDIWAKNKLTNSMHIINHLEITEDDIKEVALKKHMDSHDENEETHEYFAEIDETII